MLLLAGATPSLAQQGAAADAPDYARIERALAAELAATRTPGAAVAVVRDGRIAWTKELGAASAETGAPVAPDMPFQVGSVTKALTAALVATLVADGTLALDRPIGTWISGLHPRIAAVTPHALLTQTSGLLDQPADSAVHDEARLLAHARTLGPAIRPFDGGVFSYSNPGFSLAGLAAQEAARRPFADLLAERVLAPLGMRRSTMRASVAGAWPRAEGHAGVPGAEATVRRPPARDERHGPAGGSGLWSTAPDLARFAIALMNGGRIDGVQALPADAVQRMTTGHAEVPNLFAGARYGYGLFVQPWNGVETLWHPGTAPGFSAMIRMVPARNAAVVVLVNRDGVRLERVIDTALAVLVTTSVPTAAATASSATRDTASLPIGADEMRRVAGTYANRWPVELAVVGDRLVLRRFGAELPVRRISRDRFSAAVPGTTRTEELVIGPPGADGRPLWLHMFLWAFARRE